ncbi:MAG TPA: hypothetical protein VG407_06605 [Caulobacteraceae bacterium]|jgi:hypothetical protein|nr:hypothetical protein [Caulobacteraceae bacterium]
MSALPASIDHIVDADAASALERLEGSPLVEEGQVNLIGLNSIKARLGDRWPARADQVHDHVCKSLSRFLSGRGHFVRISQTDYLVVQPDRSRYQCQTACLTFMRDLLSYFLGAAAAIDIEVREVNGLSRNRVEARLIDPTTIREDAPPATDPKARNNTLPSPDKWSPFIAADGRRIHVSCALEPVFSLAALQQVGYRLTRTVIDEATKVPLSKEAQSALSPADIELVDLAAISRGISRLNAQGASRRPPLLLIPVSYSTLGTRRGNAAVFACLKEARGVSTTRVVCELKNIEGVPTSALFSSVAILRRACYAVIGRLEQKPTRTRETFGTVGLNGFAFKYRGPHDEDIGMVASLAPDVAAMQDVAPTTMVLGLRAPREIALAKLVGATHASMRVVN